MAVLNVKVDDPLKENFRQASMKDGRTMGSALRYLMGCYCDQLLSGEERAQ